MEYRKAGGILRNLKGKQVKDLCELVTVSTERSVTTSHWATGKADGNAMMYEPGDLPFSRYRKWDHFRATSNWSYRMG